MANCINYNCSDPLGDHTLNDCGEELLGGGSGAVALECNHQLTDPSSAVQINAEIAAGRATLFKNVKIGLDAPSPVEVDSNIGCGSTKVVTYDRTGTWVDGNVNAANQDLYDNLFSGRQLGGLIIHECGTEETDTPKVTWIDASITFTGGRILPTGNNEFQRFEGAFKWRGLRSKSSIHNKPTGIFE